MTIQTDDLRAMLSAADPVTETVGYPEARTAAMVHAITSTYPASIAQSDRWARGRRIAIGVGLAGAVAVGGASAVANLRPAGEVATPPMAVPYIVNGVGSANVPIPQAPEFAQYLRFELACFDATYCGSPSGSVSSESTTEQMVDRGAIPMTSQEDPSNAQVLTPLGSGESLPVMVSEGAQWRLYAVFTETLNPLTATLEDGRTLGIPNTGDAPPDLVPAIATNGRAGWVSYLDLTTEGFTDLPVYDQDGITVIGSADISATTP